AAIIAVESLADIGFYLELHYTHQPVAHAIVAALQALRLLPVLAYPVYWWTPLLPLFLWLGYRMGGRGVLYSVCGTLVFLVVLHNFRGITLRHNVFEGADYTRRFPAGLISPPWLWDVAYVVVAALGSAVGSASRRRRGDAGNAPEPVVSVSIAKWTG